MSAKAVENDTLFLAGGGEMAALVRSKDWAKTPIGPIGKWPQSLRTTLSIVLNSRFPMFLWWGPELTCFYNDAYRSSLGQSGKHPGILGLGAKEAWTEIWDIIKPLIDQVLSGAGATWSEDQLIPIYRNGKIEDVYWTFSYSPVNDESGKVAGVLVICSETTEKVNSFKILEERNRKQVLERTKELNQLNEALKISEERYHQMVEEVQDYAILYINREGVIENWNKGAEKIKGYRSDEIIGKNFSIFYTETDRKNRLPFQLLDRASRTGRAIQEGWRVRKDGTPFWAHVVITAVHNEQNEVIGFSKVTHDLTEKKEAGDKLELYAAQLEQKNKELEIMNAELQSFAYVSSHDLQEPLRKIQTFSTRILEKDYQELSESAKDYFMRMQNAAKRMQTLIEDLLAYSRTNTSERIFENTDLNLILEEVKSEFREDIQQKQATIEANGLCEARVIRFQLRQLIHNIIGNALKFSKPGTPPHIILKCEIVAGSKLNVARLLPQKDYYHLSVSDNGIGFDPVYKDRIFEVFQRLHGKDEYKGTGIGLAIVKKIVENHNGIIIAAGELNIGAIFDIYLPVPE